MIKWRWLICIEYSCKPQASRCKQIQPKAQGRIQNSNTDFFNKSITGPGDIAGALLCSTNKT
jgi:hypothetical protein